MHSIAFACRDLVKRGYYTQASHLVAERAAVNWRGRRKRDCIYLVNYMQLVGACSSIAATLLLLHRRPNPNDGVHWNCLPRNRYTTSSTVIPVNFFSRHYFSDVYSSVVGGQDRQGLATLRFRFVMVTDRQFWLRRMANILTILCGKGKTRMTGDWNGNRCETETYPVQMHVDTCTWNLYPSWLKDSNFIKQLEFWSQWTLMFATCGWDDRD